MAEQMRDENEAGSNSIQVQAKRPYQRPILRRLGSLRDMTMAVSSEGSTDGARTGPPSKRRTGRGGHHLSGLERV